MSTGRAGGAKSGQPNGTNSQDGLCVMCHVHHGSDLERECVVWRAILLASLNEGFNSVEDVRVELLSLSKRAANGELMAVELDMNVVEKARAGKMHWLCGKAFSATGRHTCLAIKGPGGDAQTEIVTRRFTTRTPSAPKYCDVEEFCALHAAYATEKGFNNTPLEKWLDGKAAEGGPPAAAATLDREEGDNENGHNSNDDEAVQILEGMADNDGVLSCLADAVSSGNVKLVVLALRDVISGGLFAEAAENKVIENVVELDHKGNAGMIMGCARDVLKAHGVRVATTAAGTSEIEAASAGTRHSLCSKELAVAHGYAASPEVLPVHGYQNTKWMLRQPMGSYQCFFNAISVATGVVVTPLLEAGLLATKLTHDTMKSAYLKSGARAVMEKEIRKKIMENWDFQQQHRQGTLENMTRVHAAMIDSGQDNVLYVNNMGEQSAFKGFADLLTRARANKIWVAQLMVSNGSHVKVIRRDTHIESGEKVWICVDDLKGEVKTLNAAELDNIFKHKFFAIVVGDKVKYQSLTKYNETYKRETGKVPLVLRALMPAGAEEKPKADVTTDAPVKAYDDNCEFKIGAEGKMEVVKTGRDVGNRPQKRRKPPARDNASVVSNSSSGAESAKSAPLPRRMNQAKGRGKRGAEKKQVRFDKKTTGPSKARDGHKECLWCHKSNHLAKDCRGLSAAAKKFKWRCNIADLTFSELKEATDVLRSWSKFAAKSK